MYQIYILWRFCIKLTKVKIQSWYIKRHSWSMRKDCQAFWANWDSPKEETKNTFSDSRKISGKNLRTRCATNQTLLELNLHLAHPVKAKAPDNEWKNVRLQKATIQESKAISLLKIYKFAVTYGKQKKISTKYALTKL